MRKQLLASTAAIMLATGVSQAQESGQFPANSPTAEQATQDGDQITNSTNENMDTGVAAGGATGAIAGAVVGGPVGAVVGGFAGAMLGAAASVPEPAVDYVVANPVEPVMIEGDLGEGSYTAYYVKNGQVVAGLGRGKADKTAELHALILSQATPSATALEAAGWDPGALIGR